MTNKIFGIVSEKEVTVNDFIKYKRDFFSHQSDLKKYNGVPFEVVGSVEEDKIDLEVAPMFYIRFEDGHETMAYIEEVFDENKVFSELLDVEKDLSRY